MSQYLRAYLILLLVKLSVQDIYLHNPRGSNNRLNEQTATRQNANRAFDSQNNNRGGYNVGDALNKPFTTENEQYQMKYFQSGSTGQSELLVEFSAQHGCGTNDESSPIKQNCIQVVQFMCQPDSSQTNLDRIRDGLNTNTQGYTEDASTSSTQDADNNRKSQNVNLDRVLHEDWADYESCIVRNRNSGLFTADQILGINKKKYSSAIFTRQNPNGNRYGYECPEERDYYPYWHPTKWKDVAILTSNTSQCDYYKSQSFNTMPKSKCVEYYNNSRVMKPGSRWNNKSDCENNQGTWVEFYNYLEIDTTVQDEKSCNSKSTSYQWALPYDATDINKKQCLVKLPPPDCLAADWTRSNHLGNTKAGHFANYKWTLPFFPSRKLQRCVLRLRYNITTDDYSSNIDSQFNGLNSPVKNYPQVNVDPMNQALTLAIDTAQYGRVFQDRSHVFYLMPRPSQIADSDNIYNLNVRGKRGNIVQVYPGVEYDFVPSNLTVSPNDLVHIQWTGSNTHNNKPPGGDGQTGDDGQGQTGTDRQNLLQINFPDENFPLPYEHSSMWNEISLVGILKDNTSFNDDTSQYLLTGLSNNDLSLYLSTSGYYQCIKTTTCGVRSYEASANTVDGNLNTSPASLPGAIIKFKRSNSIYYFMCSRNNNFSNRSQKGSISVQ